MADLTGAPEMLGGRVKTLHPTIHGGILADRSKPEHLADLDRQGIGLIDLVVCNLYPFPSDPSIELIDVGGPTMVRAAAKNHAHVGVVVVTRPTTRRSWTSCAQHGSLSDDTRRRLARDAFAHTAAYDAAIVDWLDERGRRPAVSRRRRCDRRRLLPPTIHLTLERAGSLRYGENPHQHGARYRIAGQHSWWDDVVQHGGKELSYLNIFDADAAWRLVHELPAGRATELAVAIIKHANPCGAALDADLAAAYQRALECDPPVGLRRDRGHRRPGHRGGGRGHRRRPPGRRDHRPVLRRGGARPCWPRSARPPGCCRPRPPSRWSASSAAWAPACWSRTPTGSWSTRRTGRWPPRPRPTDAQWRDLALAWRVCARTTSNAIAVVTDGQAVGVGAGQQSRVVAAEIAVAKAGARAAGRAAASDAFFPFPDGLMVLAGAGVAAVVQPGGSVRDGEVVAAADEAGIAMVMAGGERHFRH